MGTGGMMGDMGMMRHYLVSKVSLQAVLGGAEIASARQEE